MRIMLACVVALAVLTADQVRVGIRVTPSGGGSGTLLEWADLSCAGVFKTPTIATQTFTTYYPMTYRYEGATRHYLLFNGQGHVRDYVEPTLSACGTSVASMNAATNASFGGDWGTFPVSANGGFVPGSSSTFARGLFYDTDSAQLLLSWFPSYGSVTYNNSLAGATMNAGSHTLTVNGCWGFDTGTALNTLMTGTGFVKIPATFAATYLTAGRTWGIGSGGSVGYASGNSYGPVLVAVDPPASNACATDTDYDITSYDVLERHGPLVSGPNCWGGNGNAGTGLGCTPGGAPGTIKAAQSSFAAYSVDMYTQTWDPYGGHGWHTWDTTHSMAWYDDGVKYGVVVPFSTPSGWLNTTVAAASSPTSFTATSLDMNDGTPVQVGDLLWVQTCTVGVESGCDTTNGNHLSFARVTAVNQGTKVIDFTNIGADPSTGGTHTPVVGGVLYGGGVYAHGSPTTSRFTWRFQIYDPAQYAEVKAGTRAVSEVTYTEEADFTGVVSQFGNPMSNPQGGGGSVLGPRGAVSTMADTTAHQIMVVVNSANTNPVNVVYVLDVSQAAPWPVKPILIPLAAGFAVFSLGSLLRRRA